jgi:hypothetical protein
MSEMQEVKRLQWIKGDKIGNIEVIKGESPEWIEFESGGRIAKTLSEEFMMAVGDNGPIIDSVKDEALMPTKEHVESIVKDENPIMSLFKKMESTETHTLNVAVNINTPGKDVYNILSNSFGKNVIKDTLKKYIINQLTEEVLTDSMEEAVDKIINSFKSNN